MGCGLAIKGRGPNLVAWATVLFQLLWGTGSSQRRLSFRHPGLSTQTGARELPGAGPGPGLRGLGLSGSGTSNRTWLWTPGFRPLPRPRPAS